MAERLGVAPKQAIKARQVFMRSAKTAGLFEISLDRLSLPPNVDVKPDGGKPVDQRAQKNDGKGEGGDGDEPPPNRLRFEVPIPGKESAIVMVPDDLDADDWSMLSTMMTTYIERWKRFGSKKNEGSA